MENRLEELEERIERLERKEKRRRVLGFIKFIIVLLLIGAISYGGYRLYIKVDETIKPYKKIVDKYNKAEDKVKSITDLFK